MAERKSAHGLAYVVTLAALLLLTLTSWGFSQLHLGALAPVVGLGIAFVKAMLVALFFMHVSDSRFAIQLIAVTTLVFILLLCLGIAADVAFR